MQLTRVKVPVIVASSIICFAAGAGATIPDHDVHRLHLERAPGGRHAPGRDAYGWAGGTDGWARGTNGRPWGRRRPGRSYCQEPARHPGHQAGSAHAQAAHRQPERGAAQRSCGSGCEGSKRRKCWPRKTPRNGSMRSWRSSKATGKTWRPPVTAGPASRVRAAAVAVRRVRAAVVVAAVRRVRAVVAVRTPERPNPFKDEQNGKHLKSLDQQLASTKNG